MVIKLFQQKLTPEAWGSMIGMGLNMGVLFSALPERDIDIYPRVSVAFMMSIGCVWWPLFEGMPSLLENRDVLTKELSSGAYRLVAFYAARVLSLHPTLIIMTAVPNTVVFFFSLTASTPVAQWVAQYFLVMATNIFLATCFLSIGLVIAAAIPDQHLFLVSAEAVAVVAFLVVGAVHTHTGELLDIRSLWWC